MYSILFRTIILYVLITLVIHGMGKRQVGELEMSDFVTTILLSQIISLPIEDPSVPLTHVFLPVLIIVSAEIAITFLKGRFNPLKRLFEGKPTFLVEHGRIRRAELLRVRITLDELLSEVRQQGYGDIADIDYVILEENGKFSVLPRAARTAPSAEEMKITPPERGYALPLICDGVINKENLARMKKGIGWLETTLKKQGLRPEDVFLLTLDAVGGMNLVRKEDVS